MLFLTAIEIMTQVNCIKKQLKLKDENTGQN